MASKTVQGQFAERHAALSDGARGELARLCEAPTLRNGRHLIIDRKCTPDEAQELIAAFGRTGFNTRSMGRLWRLSDRGRWLLSTLPPASALMEGK